MGQERIDPFTFKSDAIPEGDPPLHLLAFRGCETISAPFEYEIEFLCTNPGLDFDALLEKPAHLGIRQRAQNGNGAVTLQIHGVLSKLEQRGTGDIGTSYRAVLVPRLWKTGLQMQTQVHLDLSVPEIIQKELEASGFGGTDFELRVDKAKYPKREYTVQYEESDLNYLQRLCEDVGIYYYFLHEETSEKIIFADSSNHYAAVTGGGQIPYRPRDKETRTFVPSGDWQEESIQAIILSQEQVPARVTLRDYNWQTPGVSLKNDLDTIDRAASGTYYEYGAHYKNEKEGDVLAKTRAEEILSRQVRVEGSGNARSFRAGATFQLQEHPRADMNASWLLTEIRCEGSQPVNRDMGQPPRFEAGFSAIPATREFRPPRSAHRPRIDGLLTAHIDAGSDGEYSEIDEHGRYKVKLPFDLTDLGDGKASHFIRMAQPYAGGGMGMHFPLHKGTEVLIAHVNGDPDRPTIVGAVTNPETQNVVTGPNQTQCMINTGGGNNFTIEDTAGAQKMTMTSNHPDAGWTSVSWGAP